MSLRSLSLATAYEVFKTVRILCIEVNFVPGTVFLLRKVAWRSKHTEDNLFICNSLALFVVKFHGQCGELGVFQM